MWLEERKTQICLLRKTKKKSMDERGNITIDTTDIQKTVRKYYEQPYAKKTGQIPRNIHLFNIQSGRIRRPE